MADEAGARARKEALDRVDAILRGLATDEVSRSRVLVGGGQEPANDITAPMLFGVWEPAQ